MIEKSVLIVDDEPNARMILERSLAAENWTVLTAGSGNEALSLFDDHRELHIVVTDINMPAMDGITLLKKMLKRRPGTLVLMITAFADLDSSIEALRAGAFDYIIKPCRPEMMAAALERAHDKLNLSEEIRYLRAQINQTYGFESVLGQSDAIRTTVSMARQMAQANESILLSGETGTGKEFFARAIHQAGTRAKKRFVPVNCGAIPEQLLESELFGHVKGAFSGAEVNKTGLVEEAEGGTLFLDEISELPMTMQVKLLRFLQDHQVRRVGDNRFREVNVRVIAATNKPLDKAIADGRFREDLFFRLNVLAIDIPPLRQRPTDIIPALHFFLKKFSKRSGRPTLRVSKDVLSTLTGYHWPGNMRELENLARNQVVMNRKMEITAADLPAHIQNPQGNGPVNLQVGNGFLNDQRSYSEIRAHVLEEFNKTIIKEALEAEGWSITGAAKRLKTAKSNVVRLMNRFGIEKPTAG